MLSYHGCCRISQEMSSHPDNYNDALLKWILNRSLYLGFELLHIHCVKILIESISCNEMKDSFSIEVRISSYISLPLSLSQIEYYVNIIEVIFINSNYKHKIDSIATKIVSVAKPNNLAASTSCEHKSVLA